MNALVYQFRPRLKESINISLIRMDDVSMSEESEELTGLIYLITNMVDNETYVGSTFGNKYARLGRHIACAYNPRCANSKVYKHMRKTLEEHGHTVFKITVLEEYNCGSKRELEKQEQYWMDKLKPTLNTTRSYVTQEQYLAQERMRRKRKCICLCGGKTAWSGRTRHMRTTKHQKWAEQNPGYTQDQCIKIEGESSG